jgi:hypothetical protein
VGKGRAGDINSKRQGINLRAGKALETPERHLARRQEFWALRKFEHLQEQVPVGQGTARSGAG